jgi:hypothetical protein
MVLDEIGEIDNTTNSNAGSPGVGPDGTFSALVQCEPIQFVGTLTAQATDTQLKVSTSKTD